MHNGAMRSALLACVLAGCSFQHAEPPNALRDGGGDGVVDMFDAPCSYSSLFDTCATMMGTTGLTLTPGEWTYNTDTHVLALNGNVMTPPSSMVINAADGPLDIIFVSSFTLQSGATLRPTSPTLHRGFGIASTGPIEIVGIINSSDAGAGARVDADCGASTGKPGQDLDAGGGGGGGGAFKGKGGDGSKGNSDGTNSTGGAGGTAIAARPKSPIGGCDGGPGGDGDETAGGEGGDGGGAVYLASGTSITISGVIDAGGGFGARGGNNGDGGGGGGAGGMIVIEARQIVLSGVLVANGGGGGEGNTNGVDGEAGTRTTMRAKGGANGDVNGGDGGSGGARIENDGESTADLRMGGGGGGGGAAGFIAIGGSVPVIAGSAIVSPDFAAWP
jgi:hypothetical protein